MTEAIKILEQFGPFAVLLGIVLFAVYRRQNKYEDGLNAQIALLVQTINSKDAQLKDSYEDRIASAEHTTAVGAAMTTAMEENRNVGSLLCQEIAELKKTIVELKSSQDILTERLRP